MSSNLPPGVTDSMIPGNRPEDTEWERVMEDIDADTLDNEMTPYDVERAWQIGLAQWKRESATPQ